MADTARTRAALLALYADNAIGGISEQDGRDLIMSALGGYGCLHTTGGSTAQTGLDGTPAQVTGFASTIGVAEQCTPDHTTDDITIDVGGAWLVLWQISFSGSANTTFNGSITCTGTGTVHGGTFQRKISSGGDVGFAAAIALVTGAVPNDTVECMMASSGSADEITPTEMSLVAIRVA